MSSRNRTNIDYKVFASTGKKVLVDINSSESSESLSNMATKPSSIDELGVVESTLYDEIMDVIEDNAPESINQSVDLMKSSIQKIEALRLLSRTKHRKIKLHIDSEEYSERYEKSYTFVIKSISSFIKTLNQHFQHQQIGSINLIQEVNEEKVCFITTEMERSMKYLQASSTCNVK